MATAAQPRPAQLPLPGGREGATVRVRPLLTATMKAPPGWVRREPGRIGRLRSMGLGVPSSSYLVLPIPAFLVEHPAAGALLVDTGFHSSVAVAPRESLGRVGGRLFGGIRMEPEQAVAAQLREHGIATGDVRCVVMTHLHFDHASAVSDFPDATFVFSAREWEAAARGGLLQGYVRRQFDHAFDYRTIDFDDPGVPSVETFGRGVDLLGDGSVRLVSTPGHTHGHLSVLLRLRERELVVCGDAAYTRRTLDHGDIPLTIVDEHLFRRSLRELQLFRREHPDAVMVPGHDLEAWRELEPVYE